MKASIYFIVCFFFFSGFALAATPGSMNQGNMQNMMQVMQQVQQCMAQIDQSQLEKLKVTSERMKKEIDSLCSQGKRDSAMKAAMKFGKEIASDPTVQQMRKCGEMAQGALPMADMVPSYDKKDYTSRHVCDE
ncbi:MAG: hypothetical protein P8X39_04885 [Desulfofustis sp.]|jgi:hypothetical protein